MKKLAFLILLSASTLFAAFPLTITDDVGLTAVINKEPLRIVSLGPSNTEILFSLGLGERVCGVTSYCNFPEAAKKKEKVGDFITPNIEKILSLRPDLVLCAGGVQKDLALKLKSLNIPAVTLYPKNLEEILKGINTIGLVCGKEKEAAEYSGVLKKRLDSVRARVKGLARPRVYLEIWNAPLTSAGKGSFVDELITISGGENIFSGTDQTFPNVGAEEVVMRNPEIIVTAYMDKAGKMKKEIAGRQGWGSVAAVKNGNIFDEIDSDILLRAGPRLVAGIEVLAERIHPAALKKEKK